MPESLRGTVMFGGFASPTSNTTFTPNQFFDVCLPHRSRGCVRVVAYMLRKTLGWSDEHGNPLHEQVATPYDELIRKAGVGRDSIKAALAEAQQFGFIRCLRQPSPNRAGHAAVTGLYELRWDEGSEYIKDPAIFSGFYSGDGCRTYVPNQLFDVVIRHETLSVAKVVGSIARLSIGFVNKFGHRRQHVALSMTHIQRYARIRSRTKLAEAIEAAKSRQYVRLVEAGVFDPNGGRHSRAATYALKWLEDNADSADGRKGVPALPVPQQRSEISTGDGLKNVPVERSIRGNGLETIPSRNKTLKQKPGLMSGNTVGDAESIAACYSTLKGEGFDEQTARRFAVAYPIQRVLNQIEWLPMRGPAKNRLGLLRRAIEQDYAKPGSQKYDRSYFSSPDTDLRKQLAYKLTLKPR